MPKTAEKTITMPTVHLNGTSRSELFNGHCEVAGAMRHAIDAICKYGPNQRDYYVMPGAWVAVSAEHDARLAKLREVLADYEAILEHLVDV